MAAVSVPIQCGPHVFSALRIIKSNFSGLIGHKGRDQRCVRMDGRRVTHMPRTPNGGAQAHGRGRARKRAAELTICAGARASAAQAFMVQ